jgi:hypothetical protein
LSGIQAFALSWPDACYQCGHLASSFSESWHEAVGNCTFITIGPPVFALKKIIPQMPQLSSQATLVIKKGRSA